MRKLERSRLLLVAVFLVLAMLFIAYVTLPENSTDHLIKTESGSTSIFGRNVYANKVEPGDKADPNYVIQFPADHSAHNNFDIEWWYVTANLTDESGENYGLQWTLFRFRNPQVSTKNENTWNNQHIFMAHASLHSTEAHWFSEKFAKGGVGNAEVSSSPFALFIDDWRWQNRQGEDTLLPAMLTFSAQGKNSRANISLDLTQTGPFVKHGENGYSIKSGNRQHASHYYSAPFIKVKGSVDIIQDNNTLRKSLSGQAWYDHEWTSQLLDGETQGWDWLSLHLHDGRKIMAFRMRLATTSDYITGSLISKNGDVKTLYSQDMTLKPLGVTEVNNRKLPLLWQLTIPKEDIDISIRSLKENQWNNASVSYYEGMVSITGSHSGEGFLELTGY